MSERMRTTLIVAATGLIMTLPATAFTAEKIEGTVVGTKLTACDFGNKRCEGYLTLEPKTTGAKAEPMSIRVKSGTAMTHGSEQVLLPSLRGNVVSVSYEKEKGENLAKTIVVTQVRK